MRKFNLGCILATLALLVFVLPSFVYSDSGTPSTRKKQTWTAEQTFDDGLVVKDKEFRLKSDNAQKTRFRIDKDGNTYWYDSDGNLDEYISSDNPWSNDIVVIDTLAELSSWSIAQIAGVSYFQMEAGKTYIVDLNAINTDSAMTTGTGVSMVAWSGVTALLPLATAANHLQTVTVMYGVAGSPVGGSGSTEIYVYTAPETGSTVYRGFDLKSQNATIMATSGSSVVTVSSTGPSYNINSYGEMATWMLFYDSAVSAQLINRIYP